MRRAPAGCWKRWSRIAGKCASLAFGLLLALGARNDSLRPDVTVRAREALRLGLEAAGFDPQALRASVAENGGSAAESPGRRLARSDLASLTGIFTQSAAELAYKNEVSEFLALDSALAPSPAGLSRLSHPDGAALAIADSLDRLLNGTGEAFLLLVEAERHLRRAFEELTPAEFERLAALADNFPLYRDEWPDYPVAELAELAAKVRIDYILGAVLTAEKAAGAVRKATAGRKWPKDGAPGELDSPWGRIVIGGPGPDEYDSSALLIIDPGGNDTYRLEASAWPRVRMIVDLGGDDRYESAGAGAAPGRLTWLEDLAGNDLYQAGSFSQGCGLVGAGILVDRAGNDRYRGGLLCQGAAFYGVGCLVDLEGDDSYELEFGGQGACFAAGVGLLADLAGRDSYISGGKYPDYREKGAFKSFAQGAAAGLRPFSEGGTALLYDRSGDDVYEAGYFAQGAGYWGGAGLLLEGAGSDSYRASRYGQGCGLHFAAGCLIDLAGDDRYALGGVGQGAGEDRAYGLLIENTGNDTYSAGWMGRGAGGAGGVGVLLELAGSDNYARAGSASDGWGGRTWELAGLGFLLDYAGEDLYAGTITERKTTRTSAWGAAVRLPAGR